MRIEGISEVSAPQLTGNAFEQHAPVRTATTQRTARPAQNDRPTTEVLADGGLRVTALTYGLEGDAPDLRVAQVGPTGIDAPVTVPVLAPPLSSPPAARWVVSAGGGHLADRDSPPRCAAGFRTPRQEIVMSTARKSKPAATNPAVAGSGTSTNSTRPSVTSAPALEVSSPKNRNRDSV